MDSDFETRGNEPQPIHHALFGREVTVNSVEDLVESSHKLRFAIDPVGVIEQMKERDVREFIDLYAAHAEAFDVDFIRRAFARRGNEKAELPWSDNEDIGLASEIANQIKGEINRKITNPDENTPLLRVLFPK